MCGINGYIGQKTKKSIEKIQNMNKVTVHRGPDNSSYKEVVLTNTHVYFGHNRLSIIDLHESANQPFHSPCNRYELIYNGELYNYIELKEILQNEGIVFETSSDTEVVLQSIIYWGAEKAFQKMNGMWAIAFLDTKKEELILSRDRFGEKPFYYCYENDEFYFSSEIKAILEVSEKKKINLLTLNRFLLNGSLDSSNETFFENISKIPAASYTVINLTKDFSTLSFSKYWDILNIKCNPDIKIDMAINAFETIFDDAVKIRLRSDVKVGTLLSGGLDSSAITEVMAKHIPDLEILSAISNDPRYSEEKFIDSVSDYLGVQPIKVNLDNDPKKIYNLLETVLWHNDEPMPSFSTIAHYLLMEQAHKQDIKVILSGQGADELLGGYQKYYIYYLIQLLREKHYLTFAKEGFAYLFNGGLIKQFSLKEANRYLPSFMKKKIKKTDVRTSLLKALDSKVEKLNTFVDVKERQILDLVQYSVPVLTHYEDRMSMAFSREIRLPFLDYRLVELALSLPNAMKMKDGWTKWILRKVFAGRLPDAITWRKDKKGFTTPQEKWFRDELKTEIDMLFNEDLLVEKYDLMEKEKIQQFYQEFLTDEKIWYKEVFNIISIEIWLRTYKKHLLHTQSSDA